MVDIDLKKIQPGDTGLQVSDNISYNFNALLSEIQALKEEITKLKNDSNIQIDGTVNSTVVVSCSPTSIIATAGETKVVDIVLKVTNNNTELTYGSQTSLDEFYVQNLNTSIKSIGGNIIGSVKMTKTAGNKIVFHVTINSSSPDSANVSFDVVVNGLSYTQVIPVTVINANVPTGRSVFVSTVFKRSTNKPSRPSGGSYDNPVPNGWNDGIPSGTDTLYTSHRRFTSDGGGNQEAFWSDPVIVQNVQNEIEVCFSACESPKAPSKHGVQNDECWHSEGTEDDIWMAISLMENGIWGDWSILKIKGEDGKTPNHQMTIYKESDKYPYEDQPTIMTPANFVDKEDNDIKNDLGEKDTQDRNKGWKSKPGELSSADNRWYFCVGQIDGETNTVIYNWSEPLELAPRGLSGQTVFMSTVFKRGTSETITAPIAEGTDFNNPVPMTEGWSDGIPPIGETGEPVWESHRKFTSDGKFPQDGQWSSPVMMADSSGFDCCYSASPVFPDEPSNHGEQNDEIWHNIGTPDDIWMATSYRNTTTQGWTPWVITRIKGENGEERDYMQFIYKKSPSGKPSTPDLTDPRMFVDSTSEQLSDRNKGWKSSPSGDMDDWYMSCALIDGTTGQIDTTTNPQNTWTEPVLVHGAKGDSGDSGISIYFDVNPIVGVEDISTKTVDTSQTKSNLSVYKNGKKLNASEFDAGPVPGAWMNVIGYRFAVNNNTYEFAITNFNKQNLTSNKPANGVARFRVRVDGTEYIVHCAWLCNWLGTFRTEIFEDCKKDISEKVKQSLDEEGKAIVASAQTVVQQSTSGFTVSASTLQSKIDVLDGKYSTISSKVGSLEVTAGQFNSYQQKVDEQGEQITQIRQTTDQIGSLVTKVNNQGTQISEIQQKTDRIDSYVAQVTEQGKQIAGIRTDVDNLDLYVKDEIASGLTRTGIDIKQGTVTIQSNNFYVKNNNGDTSLLIGEDGMIQNKFINASDEGISIKLKNAGIDINEGTIELNAEKTTIKGNMQLHASDNSDALTLFDENNVERTTVMSQNIGPLSEQSQDTLQKYIKTFTVNNGDLTVFTMGEKHFTKNTVVKITDFSWTACSYYGYYIDDSGKLQPQLISNPENCKIELILVNKDNSSIYVIPQEQIKSSGTTNRLESVFTKGTLTIGASATYYIRVRITWANGSLKSPFNKQTQMSITAYLSSESTSKTLVGANGVYITNGASDFAYYGPTGLASSHPGYDNNGICGVSSVGAMHSNYSNLLSKWEDEYIVGSGPSHIAQFNDNNTDGEFRTVDKWCNSQSYGNVEYIPDATDKTNPCKILPSSDVLIFKPSDAGTTYCDISKAEYIGHMLTVVSIRGKGLVLMCSPTVRFQYANGGSVSSTNEHGGSYYVLRMVFTNGLWIVI